METRSIGTLWMEFAALSVPSEAPQIQHDEMRRAFFAGSAAVLGELQRLEERDRGPEIVSYIDEVQIFLDEVVAATAPPRVDAAGLLQAMRGLPPLPDSPVPALDPSMVPPYWRNEVSGQLQPAVTAFVQYYVQPSVFPMPTPQQVGLVIQYLKQYIHAECWDGAAKLYGQKESLANLRSQADGLQTITDCKDWLHEASQYGFDPL